MPLLTDVVYDYGKRIIEGINTWRRMSWAHICKVVPATYNLVGQDLYPIEGSVGTFREINEWTWYKGLASIIPISITLLASVTVIPFFGNGWESLRRGFKAVANLSVWDTDRPVRFYNIKSIEEDDSRGFFRQLYGAILGLVGVCIGAVVATVTVGVRIIYNTIENIITVAKKMAQLLMHQEDKNEKNENIQVVQNEEDNQKQKRLPSDWFPKLLGGLGYFPLGVVFGALGMAAVAAGRIISNSYKAANRIFYWFANKALDNSDRIKSQVDDVAAEAKWENRHWFRNVLSVPGFILGGFLGVVSYFAIGAARVIGNSAKTASRFFKSGINLLLNQEDKFAPKDVWGGGDKQSDGQTDRTILQRDVLGGPGYAVGFLMTVIAAPFVILGRIVTNTFKTSKEVWASMSQRALHPDDKPKLERFTMFPKPAENNVVNQQAQDQPVQAQQDPKIKLERSILERFVLGALGLIFGFAAGFVSVATILVARACTNSKINTIRVYRAFVNMALADEDGILKQGYYAEPDRRTLPEIISGAFGILVGSVSGALSDVAIACGRFLTNNAKSFARVFNTVVNFSQKHPWYGEPQGFHEDYLWDANTDKRHPVLKGITAIGAFLGGVCGVIGLVTLKAIEVFQHNLETAGRIVMRCANAVLHEKYESDFYALRDENNQVILNHKNKKDFSDPRHPIVSYVVGFPGLVIGTVVGVLTGGVIAIGRTVTNSFLNMLGMTVAGINLPFAAKQKPFIDLPKDDRKFIEKVLGWPGVVIGLGCGIAGAVLSTVARGISQSVQSFAALSGSLFNGAVETPVFGGLHHDTREEPKKYVGILGYALAAAVSGVVSSALFVVRKIPTTLGMLAGLLGALVIAPAKAINKNIVETIQKKSRFGVQLENEPAKNAKQKLQNLVSSLNASGRLEVGEIIKDNGAGNKTMASHLRKCVTFDMKTPTEFFLDEVVKEVLPAMNEAGVNDCTSTRAWKTAVEKVSNHYAGGENCCFGFFSQRRNLNEVKKVADFVATYLNDQNNAVKQVPDDLYKQPGDQPWTDTFLGKKPVVPAADPGNDGRDDDAPGMRPAN